MLREVDVSIIQKTVKRLFIEANMQLPNDVYNAICNCKIIETNVTGKTVLNMLIDNVKAAEEISVPICQDTGLAVVFIKIGQDVHFVGGDFTQAVNQGVRDAYVDGLLRKSVVGDPLNRVNTNDNTPAIIHTEIVAGDKVEITAAPKGFGSENMSGVRMLVPAAGRQGVVQAVLDIVKNAGSNPCPPMVIGVGIGGDFEECALLSKKALCRSLDCSNNNPFYAELENELLEKINALGIGPQGFGGATTALGVNVEYAPTHIAGLPVAVNIGCHVTRHKKAII
ncbi:MAG: fumarate hydratase [Ruminococcaceae bacterium]|nr:fumarate hydratase [Oscillospiraceae bacterium]